MSKTTEEKLLYMDVALQIAGYKFHHQDIEVITSLYDLILEKKGKTDLDSITEIKYKMAQKYMSPPPIKES